VQPVFVVEETVLAHGDTHLGGGSDEHNFNSTASNSALFQGALNINCHPKWKRP